MINSNVCRLLQCKILIIIGLVKMILSLQIPQTHNHCQIHQNPFLLECSEQCLLCHQLEKLSLVTLTTGNKKLSQYTACHCIRRSDFVVQGKSGWSGCKIQSRSDKAAYVTLYLVDQSAKQHCNVVYISIIV
jgi:hypothetical protein